MTKSITYPEATVLNRLLPILNHCHVVVAVNLYWLGAMRKRQKKKNENTRMMLWLLDKAKELSRLATSVEVVNAKVRTGEMLAIVAIPIVASTYANISAVMASTYAAQQPSNN